MARNKKIKKPQEQKDAEPQGPANKTAMFSTEASETTQPASYAAAAAKPPAEDNKIIDPSATTPAVAIFKPAGGPVIPINQTASGPDASSIFEDDAVDVAFPVNEPGTSDDQALGGSPGSDFSRLKKDEISDTGSPGQLVKKPGEEEVGTQAPSGPTSESTTLQPGTGTETKASSPNRSMIEALSSQKAKNASVGLSSKADWDKAFGSEDDGQQATGEGADEGAGEGAAASGGTAAPGDTEPGNPPATATTQTDLAKVIIEKDAIIHDCEVTLQDYSDEIEAKEKERAELQSQRDNCRKDLAEARATLQTVHERRQKLQDEKDKYRLREADWEREKARLEAQIDQLSKASALKGGNGKPSGSPGDSSSSSSSNSGSGGSGRRPQLGDDPGNAALRNEIRKLQDELQTQQAELEKAQEELKTLRSYKTTQEARKVVRAGIASCTTENEKLEKYGGTMDRTSRLYRMLKKLADFLDNGGPKPTVEEFAQIKTFEDCLAERKRIMVLARTHPDARGFMTPYLDKWDGLALASDWGSTLTARMMATRVALDKLGAPEQ